MTFRRYRAAPRSDAATQVRLDETAREWGHNVSCPLSLLHLLDFKSCPEITPAESACAFSDQETLHSSREDVDYAGETCPCRLPANLTRVLMCSLAIERAKRNS